MATLSRPSLIHSPFSISSRQWLSTLLLTLVPLLSQPTQIQAQTSELLIRSEAAYATTSDGRYFYVHGGRSGKADLGTNQLLFLDLSKGGWTSVDPPWVPKPITTAGAGSSWGDFLHTASFTKDQKEMVIWSTRTATLSKYNIVTDTWSNPIAFPAEMAVASGEILKGVKAVTDPVSGLIYVPSGSLGNQMSVYDPEKNTGSVLPMPAAMGITELKRYSATWSTVRGTMLLWGGGGKGPTGAAVNSFLWEFNPTNQAWTKLEPGGAPAPGQADYSCMVPAQNGSKILLFGGSTGIPPGGNLATIHILDVNAMTWTLGAEGAPQEKRSRMACSASGDNFMAWGGGAAPFIMYNIKENKWTPNYSLGTFPPLAPGTGAGNATIGTGGGAGNSGGGGGGGGGNGAGGASGGDGTGSSSSNIGAIAGGAAGGLVLLLIVGFVFYRRGRRGGVTAMKAATSDSSSFSDKDRKTRSRSQSRGSKSSRNSSVEDLDLEKSNEDRDAAQMLLMQEESLNQQQPSMSKSLSPTMTPAATIAQQQHGYFPPPPPIITTSPTATPSFNTPRHPAEGVASPLPSQHSDIIYIAKDFERDNRVVHSPHAAQRAPSMNVRGATYNSHPANDSDEGTLQYQQQYQSKTATSTASAGVASPRRNPHERQLYGPQELPLGYVPQNNYYAVVSSGHGIQNPQQIVMTGYDPQALPESSIASMGSVTNASAGGRGGLNPQYQSQGVYQPSPLTLSPSVGHLENANAPHANSNTTVVSSIGSMSPSYSAHSDSSNKDLMLQQQFALIQAQNETLERMRVAQQEQLQLLHEQLVTSSSGGASPSTSVSAPVFSSGAAGSPVTPMPHAATTAASFTGAVSAPVNTI